MCDGNSVLWYTNALLMIAASPHLVINAVVYSDSVLVAVHCVFGEQCNRMSFCPTVASDMPQVVDGEFMHALWCV